MPLDQDLFEDFQDLSGFNVFSILETEDISKVGIYKISYRVYLTEYPENTTEKRAAFTVTVIDPCNSPLDISSPSELLID